MKVNVRIDAGCREPRAELQIAKLTPSVQAAIALLEKEGEGNFLAAQREGKIFLVEPEKVELVRTEGRELVLYDRQKNRYTLGKKLYELQELLGGNFVRISKSAIVNLRLIHHVEASFNGTMEVVMKNGMEEMITRSFRQQVKERLGV